MTARIAIPTFDVEVVLIYGVDRKNAARILGKMQVDVTERLQDEYVGLTLDLGNMTWVIYIPDMEFLDDIQLARTLSHEATHVVLQLMEKVGIHDDETFCYTQDSLLGMLLDKVARWRQVKEQRMQRKTQHPKDGVHARSGRRGKAKPRRRK